MLGLIFLLSHGIEVLEVRELVLCPVLYFFEEDPTIEPKMEPHVVFLLINIFAQIVGSPN